MRNFYTHDFERTTGVFGVCVIGTLKCRRCLFEEYVFSVPVSHEYKGTPEQNVQIWEAVFTEIPKTPTCDSVIVRGVLRA